MLKTAKNTLKKAAKDQVEFVGAILTGVFVGSIFTLAYVKCWEEGDLTFADIGGMLAGFGTIGLLRIAIRTSTSWKKQLNESAKQSSLDEFFKSSFLVHEHLMKLATHLKGFKLANEEAPSILVKEKADNLNSARIKVVEIRMKQQVSVLKLFVNWQGLKISGTTPMDIISYQDQIEAKFIELPPEIAFEESKAIFENFEKLLIDTYCKYGRELIHKP